MLFRSPDVSPTPSFVDRSRWNEICLVKQFALSAPMTGRHQAAGHLKSGETYFFLATLRVFFAVFFTALFAFLAFFAFLAMLPS